MRKRSSEPARPKRPTDVNQLAVFIVEQATGEKIAKPNLNGKNPAAVELGRLGGLKGGKARAEKLSSKQRRRIALKAVRARWAKRAR
jgi:hypothetical protein